MHHAMSTHNKRALRALQSIHTNHFVTLQPRRRKDVIIKTTSQPVNIPHDVQLIHPKSTVAAMFFSIRKAAHMPLITLDGLQRTIIQANYLLTLNKSGLCWRVARRKPLLKESLKRSCEPLQASLRSNVGEIINMLKDMLWLRETKTELLGVHVVCGGKLKQLH